MSTNSGRPHQRNPQAGWLPPDVERPTNVRWIVFGLGCGTSWFLYLHRYTFALIKPELRDEWGLSNTELGLLDSAFAVCYSVFQFPSGVLADLAGAHLFLGSIILLWSLSLGLHAWAPNLDWMWYVRALFGASQAGAFASVSRVTRTWFPLATRTSAQGWMGVFSGRIGGLSANLLFAALLIGVWKFDWRTAVYILAAAGLVHGVLYLSLFRNSPRKHPLVNRAEADLIEDVLPAEGGTGSLNETSGGTPAKPASQTRMTVRELFRRMSPRSVLNLLSLTLASTLSSIADNIYSAWIPLFLAEVHNLEFKEMGLYSALPLLGGAFGGACSGALNDRMIRLTGNRRWTRSLIGLSGKGTASLLLVTALVTSYENPYRFCAFLFFVKFFSDAGLACRWGTVTDIGGRATASVFAFNNSLAAFFAMIAPVIYGYVSEVAGWRPVFVIAAAVYALGATSWLLINCTIPLVREDDHRQAPRQKGLQ